MTKSLLLRVHVISWHICHTYLCVCLCECEKRKIFFTCGSSKFENFAQINTKNILGKLLQVYVLKSWVFSYMADTIVRRKSKSQWSFLNYIILKVIFIFWFWMVIWSKAIVPKLSAHHASQVKKHLLRISC